MLYNMLTRVYPFDVHAPADLLAAMAASRTPEPPSQYAAVPPAVDRVVLRCLERKPEDRYQSMEEVSDALSAAIGAVPSIDLASLVHETVDRVKAISELGNEATLTGAFATAMADITRPGVAVLEPAIPLAAPPPARSAWGWGSKPRPVPTARAPIPETLAEAPQPQAASAPSAPPPPVPRPADMPAPAPTPADDVGRPRIVPLPSTYAGDLHLVPSGDGYLLKDRHTTFGRADGNDIVLLSPNASRFHGRFVVEDGACAVEDFDSWNGVFVNDERISGQRVLAPGDIIDIGEVRFAFGR
jgi:hypothetical protein